jgi:hypothetical protein
LLTVVGGWLRFTATDFGLPEHFRPDEEFLVPTAYGFASAKDWNPHLELYPAMQMYLQYVAIRIDAALIF